MTSFNRMMTYRTLWAAIKLLWNIWCQLDFSLINYSDHMCFAAIFSKYSASARRHATRNKLIFFHMRQAKLPTKKKVRPLGFMSVSIWGHRWRKALPWQKNNNHRQTSFIIRKNRQTLLTNCTKVNYSQHVSSLALFIVEYAFCLFLTVSIDAGSKMIGRYMHIASMFPYCHDSWVVQSCSGGR
jgi:hypothetical protein